MLGFNVEEESFQVKMKGRSTLVKQKLWDSDSQTCPQVEIVLHRASEDSARFNFLVKENWDWVNVLK